MGRQDLLSIHAGIIDPVTSISLIDGTRAEIDIAQRAILGDIPAVGSKICADREVGVGKVHDRDEEGERGNREYQQDHQGHSPCRYLQPSLPQSYLFLSQVFWRDVPRPFMSNQTVS